MQIFRKKQVAAGSQLAPKPIRSRAWVIRLPGVFIGAGGQKYKGSFQTIVLAPNEEMAWEVAMRSDIWEPLPFNVKNPQVFPKDPIANGSNQAC